MNAIIKILVRLFAGKSDFKNLFLLNEFNDLTGKSRKGILALSVILALTFCALGYSVGGIKYLKSKMEDPFTNWVNMTVKPSYKDKIPSLLHHFEDTKKRDSFHLDNISKYIIEYFLFQDPNKNGFYNKKVRTIDTDGDLIKEILHAKNNNVVAGFEYTDEADMDFPKCGIIIKESTLESLGIEDISTIKEIPFKRGNHMIYTEVFAVVKELPDLCDGLVSNHFYNILQKEFGRTGFIPVNSTNKFIIHGKMAKGTEGTFQANLESGLKANNIISLDVGKYPINDNISMDEVVAYSRDYYEIDSLRTLIAELVEKGTFQFANLYIPSNCETQQQYNEILTPYYLAFNFNKLDKVRDFNNYLKDNPRFLMEITMDQVESKENFALVSRLTSFIAIILLIFSFLSIVFYINSLLTKHLEKIKQNLGTLKAFGLNNKFLVSTYVGIILLFMILSVIIAFGISLLFAYLETLFFKIPIIDLFDYRIYLTILVILIIAVVTSYYSIKKILLKTPGDLIYNR